MLDSSGAAFHPCTILILQERQSLADIDLVLSQQRSMQTKLKAGEILTATGKVSLVLCI